MNIEKYVKAGIISGIVLVGFTIIFGLILGNYNQWNYLFLYKEHAVNQEEAIEILQGTLEYKEFEKRFPDHTWDLVMRNDQAELRVGAYNQDTKNALFMELTYSFEGGNIWKRANCEAFHRFSGERYEASEQIVLPFLQTTRCLDTPEDNES
jgi:hypothetical protein